MVDVRRLALIRRAPMKRTATRDRIPEHVRAAVYSRANFACEACGYDLLADAQRRGLSLHHRVPRQAGGDRNPARHSPANLLLLCGSGTVFCHGEVESYRATAYDLGRLVKRGIDPAHAPVLIYGRGWSVLREDGHVDQAPGQVTR